MRKLIKTLNATGNVLVREVKPPTYYGRNTYTVTTWTLYDSNGRELEKAKSFPADLSFESIYDCVGEKLLPMVRCWACDTPIPSESTYHETVYKSIFGTCSCSSCHSKIKTGYNYSESKFYAYAEARMKRWEKRNPVESYATSVSVEFVS